MLLILSPLSQKKFWVVFVSAILFWIRALRDLLRPGGRSLPRAQALESQKQNRKQRAQALESQKKSRKQSRKQSAQALESRKKSRKQSAQALESQKKSRTESAQALESRKQSRTESAQALKSQKQNGEEWWEMGGGRGRGLAPRADKEQSVAFLAVGVVGTRAAWWVGGVLAAQRDEHEDADKCS
ncbi:hypothetical protein MMC07_002107 [Pseudocyphellaria aurata]|nr:hypothetical protein [Pseudocyphellaria aurata]